MSIIKKAAVLGFLGVGSVVMMRQLITSWQNDDWLWIILCSVIVLFFTIGFVSFCLGIDPETHGLPAWMRAGSFMLWCWFVWTTWWHVGPGLTVTHRDERVQILASHPKPKTGELVRLEFRVLSANPVHILGGELKLTSSEDYVQIPPDDQPLKGVMSKRGWMQKNRATTSLQIQMPPGFSVDHARVILTVQEAVQSERDSSFELKERNLRAAVFQ